MHPVGDGDPRRDRLLLVEDGVDVQLVGVVADEVARVVGRWPDDREATGRGRQGQHAVVLKQHDRPTAIFTSADTAGFGALRACRKAGLEVPRDISIVGFDDIPETSLVMPPLTTVRQPLQEMRAMAVRLLRRLMDEPDATARRTELATELVVRDSTGPPPAELS